MEVYADGRHVPVQLFPELKSRWALVVLHTVGEPVRLSGTSAEFEVSARLAEEGVRDPSSWLKGSIEEGRIRVVTDHLSTIPSFIAFGEVIGVAQWPRAIGPASVVRSPPCSILELKADGFSSLSSTCEEGSEGRPITTEELLKALEGSVSRNVGSRCAVCLSGGLDSGLLLKLVSEQVRSVVAITVGVSGSTDFQRARRAARSFGVDHVIHELTEDEVARTATYLRRVMGLERPMDLSLAVVQYTCASLARSLGLCQLVVGQGADELFGGYAKYVRALEEGGERKLEALMRSDLRELWTHGLVRDYVSAALGGATLTVPYLAPEVVSIARALPAHLKVKGSDRKVALREVARVASLPEEVWAAEKRAAQYSTGVEKVIRRWLRRTL